MNQIGRNNAKAVPPSSWFKYIEKKCIYEL